MRLDLFRLDYLALSYRYNDTLKTFEKLSTQRMRQSLLTVLFEKQLRNVSYFPLMIQLGNWFILR